MHPANNSNNKQTAESYVRSRFPELIKDNGQPVGSGFIEHLPIKPHHWLRLLAMECAIGEATLRHIDGGARAISITYYGEEKDKGLFAYIDLVDDIQSEAFYDAFLKIVKVTPNQPDRPINQERP